MRIVGSAFPPSNGVELAGPQIFSAVNLMSELVIDTEGDNHHWIQLTDDVRQRPLLFDCTNGAWANLLSIRPAQVPLSYRPGACLRAQGLLALPGA
jgi:hypothetical protein